MPDLAALKKKADDLRNSGKEPEAIKVYHQLIDLYTKAGDLKMAAWATQMIGVSYKIGAHLKEALPWYRKAIDRFRAIDDPWGVGNTLRDMALAYDYVGRHQDAKRYLLESAKVLRRAKGEPAFLGITLVKLGLVEMKLGQMAPARRHQEDGLRLIRRQGHWFFESTAYYNLAEYYIRQEQYETALEYLAKGRKIVEAHFVEEEHTRRLAQFYGSTALCLVKLERLPEAKALFKKAEDILRGYAPDVRAPVEEDIRYNELKKILKMLGVSAIVLINLLLGERL